MQEINPYNRKFSRGSWIFSTIFIFVFTSLMWLILSSPSDYFKWPASLIGQIRFTVGLLIDVLFTLMLIGVNYFFIQSYRKACISDDFSNKDTIPQTTNKIYISLICFLLVALKIACLIGRSIAKSILLAFRSKELDIPHLIMILFFGLIFLGFTVFFTIVFRKMNRAKKIQLEGKEEIYRGTIVVKQQQYCHFDHSRNTGSLYDYSIELDNGKKFFNIRKEFYDAVNEGQKVEIHVLPFVGEILKITMI
ncbi:MAG: hypothetical protein HYR91_01880 [Flavobacteriia bacterium]|nr:hypothetical protein [Flavobacteriia bacterium]